MTSERANEQASKQASKRTHRPTSKTDRNADIGPSSNTQSVSKPVSLLNVRSERRRADGNFRFSAIYFLLCILSLFSSPFSVLSNWEKFYINTHGIFEYLRTHRSSSSWNWSRHLTRFSIRFDSTRFFSTLPWSFFRLLQDRFIALMNRPPFTSVFLSSCFGGVHAGTHTHILYIAVNCSQRHS